MDALIQTVSIIAVFSMMHERVLELFRLPRDVLKRWPKWVAFLDGVTVGTFNWASGVALALLTHADLLLTLKPAPAGAQSPFITQYLEGGCHWEPLHFLGCVLMGFSTTLGSKFWHDALNGLMDFRKQMKAVPADARTLVTGEVSQQLRALATQLKVADTGDATSKGANLLVANALLDLVLRADPQSNTPPHP